MDQLFSCYANLATTTMTQAWSFVVRTPEACTALTVLNFVDKFVVLGTIS